MQYRIFFTAVQLWLDNPRKQEQIRDVGERLSKTEYEDDLDLQRDDEEESDDADEESDDDSRIDHDTDDEESEEWREDEDENENEDTLLDEDSNSEMMSLGKLSLFGGLYNHESHIQMVILISHPTAQRQTVGYSMFPVLHHTLQRRGFEL